MVLEIGDFVKGKNGKMKVRVRVLENYKEEIKNTMQYKLVSLGYSFHLLFNQLLDSFKNL